MHEIYCFIFFWALFLNKYLFSVFGDSKNEQEMKFKKLLLGAFSPNHCHGLKNFNP